LSKRLVVDTDGLDSDGRDLEALGDTVEEEDCRQSASDPTSTTGAFAFSDLDRGLVQRLNEAKSVREHGGEIVQASAVLFEVADEQGSLLIDRVDVIGAPRSASAGPPTINIPKQPSTGSTPRVSSVSSSVGMGAEAFAEAVHSGQGSSVVGDFSTHWTEGSDDLEILADKANWISQSIQAHWQDAESNAAPNVKEHGVWLQDASEWADRLAKSAEKFASAFDTAKADTPTPDELAAAKYATLAGVLTGPAALIAYMAYERMKSEALEAAANYYNDVDDAIREVGDPVAAPSLIAKQAEIPGELVEGPGTWRTEVRREGEWREYEQQATGYPAGMEYQVDVAGREKPVSFDGFDPDAGGDGLFVEAKGKGYEWMVGPDGEFNPKLEAIQQLTNEMRGQYEASVATGIPVEWRVADPRVAAAMESIAERNDFDDRITVTVVPPA
jgi:hypothetical protein